MEVIKMLKKEIHLVYRVTLDELLNNFIYLRYLSERNGYPILIRERGRHDTLMLTSKSFKSIEDTIEKLEKQHKKDQEHNRKLRKQNEVLKMRLNHEIDQ